MAGELPEAPQRRAPAAAPAPCALRKICELTALPEGGIVKFKFSRESLEREGFAARTQGRIVAYENVCRHIPISLDYGNDEFFAPDGRHFICQSHGALYDPHTGLCVRGPCEGLGLKTVPVLEREGALWLIEQE